MNEDDLELLITLDDPGDAPEEDTFHEHEDNDDNEMLRLRSTNYRK